MSHNTTRHTAAKPAVVQIQPAMLALQDAALYLSLSTRTFQTLVAQKHIKPARQISPGRVGWLVADLDTFAASLPVADALPPPNTGHRKKATNTALSGPKPAR